MLNFFFDAITIAYSSNSPRMCIVLAFIVSKSLFLSHIKDNDGIFEFPHISQQNGFVLFIKEQAAQSHNISATAATGDAGGGSGGSGDAAGSSSIVILPEYRNSSSK